jgi:hypothetical protein
MVSALVLAAMLLGCAPHETPLVGIQEDLDHNPKIRENGYTVSALSIDHGYLTVTVKGLSDEAARALRNGDSPMAIAWAKDSKVSALMDAEAILKKRDDVKGVKWVAAP